MDTTSIKHLGNNDGYDLEMSVSFSLDSVLTVSKCAFIFKMSDGDKFFNAFEGTRITKALFCLMNMLPN